MERLNGSVRGTGVRNRMLIHIVGLSEEGEEMVADPKKLVAVIKLEEERVDLDIREKKHEKELQELFSEPFFHFTSGFTCPDGTSGDAGEFIQPWDPKIVEQVLPEKLAILGLDFIVVG